MYLMFHKSIFKTNYYIRLFTVAEKSFTIIVQKIFYNHMLYIQVLFHKKYIYVKCVISTSLKRIHIIRQGKYEGKQNELEFFISGLYMKI